MKGFLSSIHLPKLSFSKVYYFLVYFLAFLAGNNFIKSRGIFSLLLIFLVLVKSFFCKEIKISKGLLGVTFFSLLFLVDYCVLYGFTMTHVLTCFVIPVGFFLIGNVLSSQREIDNFCLLKLLFSFGFGFFFNEQANLIATTVAGQSVLNNDGRILDFWTGIEISRTIYSLDLIPIISLSLAFLLYSFKGQKRFFPFFLALIAFYACVSSGFIGNRSTLIIAVFCFFILLGVLAVVMWKKTRKYAMLLLLFIFGLSLLVLAVLGDTFGLKTMLMKIPAFSRFFSEFGSQVGRFYQYQVFFANFLKYPFGGLATSDLIVDYAGGEPTNMHNVWLQMYCIGGFPLFVFYIFIAAFFLGCFFRSFSFEKNKKNLISFCSFGAVIGVFLLYLFEPLIETDIYLAFFPFLGFGFFSSLLNQGEASKCSSYSKWFSEQNVKIVWISNFLSLHTISTADELYRIYGDRFSFISLQEPLKEHLVYSSNNLSVQRPYEIRDYINHESALSAIRNGNVILYSNSCEKLIGRYRVERFHKLFILISERPYKNGEFEQYSFNSVFSSLFHFRRTFAKDYCLTMSAYAASDFIHSGQMARSRCYRWGYWVPDLPDAGAKADGPEDKTELKVVFVNRFIDWKNPLFAIDLASFLKEKNISFSLKIIGEGVYKEQMINAVNQRGLNNVVTFEGSISSDKVRSIMRQSDIVLSASTRKEGWGSCVLEGMLSGCAVVTSCGTGSAPVLIKNWETGVLFDEENKQSLFDSVLILANDRSLLRSIQNHAFSVSHECFLPGETAKRFSFWLGDIIQKGYCDRYEDGPCSLDPAFSENQIREGCKDSLLTVKTKYRLFASERNESPLGTKQNSRWALVSYVSLGLSILIGLLYTPWVVKTLGQSSYAIYSLASSICTLAAIDFGSGSIVANKIASFKFHDDKERASRFMGTVYKFYFILDCILFLVLLTIFFLLKSIYPSLTSDEISSLKSCFAVVGIFTLFSFELTPLNGVLIGNDRFILIKIFSLVSRILNVILALIFLSMGGDVFAFVAVMVFSSSFELLLKSFYCLKKCPYGGTPYLKGFDKKITTYLLKDSLWFVVITICNRMLMTVAPSILGIFCGSAQIAVFSLAWSVEGNVYSFAYALDGMFFPELSKIHEENEQHKYTNEIIKVGRIQLLVTGLIISGFVSFGLGFINNVWKVSTASVDYSDSYYCILILLVPGLFTFSQIVAENVFLVEGKMKYQSLAYVVSGVISLTAGCLLCYFYPSKGAILISSSIAFAKIVGLVILMGFLFKKALSIDVGKFYKDCFFKILPLILLMMVFGLCFDLVVPTTGWKVLIEKAIVFSLLYFFLMEKFCMNANEKRICLNLINPLKIKFQKLQEEI